MPLVCRTPITPMTCIQSQFDKMRSRRLLILTEPCMNERNYRFDENRPYIRNVFRNWRCLLCLVRRLQKGFQKQTATAVHQSCQNVSLARHTQPCGSQNSRARAKHRFHKHDHPLRFQNKVSATMVEIRGCGRIDFACPISA